MTNYAAGHAAEKRAAEHLQSLGYKIREINWKTKWCEIDIVAEKDGAVYFVEVKYRRNTNQGHGLDYITPKKLRQMAFAAESWVHMNKWGGDYQLAALGIDNKHFELVELA